MSAQLDNRSSRDTLTMSTDTVTISRSTFEKLCAKKERLPLDKRWANPAPVALAGLVMALTPLACQLMGWRGSMMSGAANNGAHFFCGGILMFVGGLLEFFLGHTFAFIVFCSYGGFFASLAATIAEFSTSTDPAYFASYAFFYLFMGLLSMVFLVSSVATNVCYFVIFLAYSIAFPLLAGADWNTAMGNTAIAHRCTVGAGAACFVVAIMGWVAFASFTLESVNSPVKIPVGDLSFLGKKSEPAVDAEQVLPKSA